MFRFPLKAAALTVAVAAHSAAGASVLTLQADGLTPGALLGNGDHAGVFLLPASITGPVQVHSASFAFAFDDDLDALVGPVTSVSLPVITDYTLDPAHAGPFSYYYQRTSTQTTTNTSTRAGESASLSMGSGNAPMGAAGTSPTTTTTDVTTLRGNTLDQSYFVGGFCNGCYSTYYQYTTDSYSRVIDNVIDSTGPFGISGSISDAALLSEIASAGGLGFKLTMTGDAYYLGGSLTLDYSPIEAPAIGPAFSPAAVPAPNSLALASLALGALGALGVPRRRRSGS